MTKRTPLGKDLQAMGINELLSTVNRQPEYATGSNQHQVQDILCDHIFPSRYQARQHWDQQALRTLTQSIQSHGILQPVVVREIAPQRYELIAGERRWRAAKLAGLKKIPAIVKDFDDQTTMLIGLVENLQREQLNVMDQAEGYLRLVTDFELTHEQIALLVGKSRSSITNFVRLCQLDNGTKAHLKEGRLEMGHARCLLALPENRRDSMADRASSQGWSVRQTEQAVRDYLQHMSHLQGNADAITPASATDQSKNSWQMSDQHNQRWQRVSQRWQGQMKLGKRTGYGHIKLHFKSQDELDKLLAALANS